MLSDRVQCCWWSASWSLVNIEYDVDERLCIVPDVVKNT